MLLPWCSEYAGHSARIKQPISRRLRLRWTTGNTGSNRTCVGSSSLEAVTPIRCSSAVSIMAPRGSGIISIRSRIYDCRSVPDQSSGSIYDPNYSILTKGGHLLSAVDSLYEKQSETCFSKRQVYLMLGASGSALQWSVPRRAVIVVVLVWCWLCASVCRWI